MPSAPVIKLVVPLPPPGSANSRYGHWRVGHGKKKKYWELLDILVGVRHIAGPPAKPIDPAYMTVDCFVHNFHDDDGMVNRLKPLVDWLHRSGYIVGDSKKQLRQKGFPTQTIDRAKPRVELTIRQDKGRR